MPITNSTNGRSGYENKIIANVLKHNQTDVIEYESVKLPYTVVAEYTPDFILHDKTGTPKIFIEAKGYFSPADRKKMLAVKSAHPHLDIRLLFQKPKNKLNPKSKTRYYQWAEQHNFLWATGEAIPKKWIDEL